PDIRLASVIEFYQSPAPLLPPNIKTKRIFFPCCPPRPPQAFAKSARRCFSFPAEHVPDFAKRSTHARQVSFQFPPAFSLPCSKASTARGLAHRVSPTRLSMQLETAANISLDEGRLPGARLCPLVHELFHLHPAHPAIRISSLFEPRLCVSAPSPRAATFSSNFAHENTGTVISPRSFHPPDRKVHRKANPQALSLPLMSNWPVRSPRPLLANRAGRFPRKIPRPLLAPSHTPVPAPNPPNAAWPGIPRAG